MSINPYTSADKETEVYGFIDTPTAFNQQTNTKITTNTTTEDFILSFEETEGTPSSFKDVKENFYDYVELYPSV